MCRPKNACKQIMLNMERWRWMPDNLGENHLLVNLAAFELQRVQSSTIVERMNVVVGAVATQTPEFSDEMEYVELNPTWTVPYSIATKEMLPKLRSNPYAYAEEFEVFVNGSARPPGAPLTGMPMAPENFRSPSGKGRVRRTRWAK